MNQVFQWILTHTLLHQTNCIKVLCCWIYLINQSITTKRVSNFNTMQATYTIKENTNNIYRIFSRIVFGLEPVMVVNEVHHFPHPCSLLFSNITNNTIVDTIKSGRQKSMTFEKWMSPLSPLTPFSFLSVLFTVNSSDSSTYGMGSMVLPAIPSFLKFRFSVFVIIYSIQFQLNYLLPGLIRGYMRSLKLEKDSLVCSLAYTNIASNLMGYSSSLYSSCNCQYLWWLNWSKSAQWVLPASKGCFLRCYAIIRRGLAS